MRDIDTDILKTMKGGCRKKGVFGMLFGFLEELSNDSRFPLMLVWLHQPSPDPPFKV